METLPSRHVSEAKESSWEIDFPGLNSSTVHGDFCTHEGCTFRRGQYWERSYRACAISAGFEVCFVDINEAAVASHNEHNQYKVALANMDKETLVDGGVTAIHSTYEAMVAQHIAEADLVTTAIGAGKGRESAAVLRL